eukprot:937309-Amphidinium_carterae.1
MIRGTCCSLGKNHRDCNAYGMIRIGFVANSDCNCNKPCLLNCLRGEVQDNHKMAILEAI